MSDPRQPSPDPLDCRGRLRDALAQDALDTIGPADASSAARLAALELAIALGRCRLFGVEPDAELDGSLSASLALAALACLDGLLPEWAELARTLGERWDAARDSFEADGLPLDLLELRMDVWAASIACDEAYFDALDARAAELPLLTAALDRLNSALGQFNDELEQQQPLLSSAAETNLLSNWRANLTQRYLDEGPWWLDGRLEEAARECRRKALAAMPGSAVWRRLQQTARHRRIPARREGDAAAASVPGASPMLHAALSWLSPDGRFRAEVQLPDCSDDKEETRPRLLNFTTTADEAPAVALAGQEAALSGAVAIIGPEAQVWITLALLRAPNLELRVGQGEPWTFE